MSRMKPNMGCILPDELIDAILVRLPIKDAMRTSILSSNWNSNSHAMSKLVFNNECLPHSTNQRELLSRLVYIVDSVLTLHVGPIHRFELSIDLPSCSTVDRWINFLSRHQIKEIVINFKIGASYRVPSCLFRCEALTCLHLHNCLFNIPDSFQQFAKLVCLILRRICVPGGRIEALISGCPSLRYLLLFRLECSGYLNINSPGLREVVIHGSYDYISLCYSRYLTKAHISLPPGREKSKTPIPLCHLPNIQTLQLKSYTIQRFHSYGSNEPRLPVRFDRLKSLFVDMDFQSREDFMAALFLIRSSSNLEVLDIKVLCIPGVAGSITNNWEPERCDLTLDLLKTVNITGMTGTKLEQHLIKCILNNAPVLETMTVSINHQSITKADDSEIFTNMLRYRRASTQAEIIYRP